MASMDLQALRGQTRIEHEATEALLPLMGPEITLPVYVDALRSLYRIVEGWERWAETQAPPECVSVLRDHQRAFLLRKDLRHFGLAAPPDPLPLEEFVPLLSAASDTASPNEAAFLGALYVVEGSTLGGQYIARQVETVLGLVQGEGDAYFLGHGERTGERWREIRGILEAAPDTWIDGTVAAAKCMFGIYSSVLADAAGKPGHRNRTPEQTLHGPK